MKKLFLIMGILAVCITSISKDIQHEAVAVNIEVPVRVFKGDTFIDNLTINDFEVYEDGVLQKIDALYLIKKTMIEREEKPRETQVLIKPNIARHFILVFEVINWLPLINDSIEFFFDEVYQPGDTLIITTPIKTYRLKKEMLVQMPKSQICDQFKSILKTDILKGNMEYKSLIREIKSFEKTGGMMTGSYLVTGRYKVDLFNQIKNYKYFDEQKLKTFVEYLKNIEGQKHVFLFYQREESPFPSGLDEFAKYSKDSTFDVDLIKQIFSDSKIATHFLFLTNKLEEHADVEYMDGNRLDTADVSFQVFNAFNEIAKTTGGISYASANPFAAFKRASDASENYYLLYYSPKDYKSDGKFRNIKIKVKGKKYRVLHRAGYFAD